MGKEEFPFVQRMFLIQNHWRLEIKFSERHNNTMLHAQRIWWIIMDGSRRHEPINHMPETVSSNIGHELIIGKLTTNFPSQPPGSFSVE